MFTDSLFRRFVPSLGSTVLGGALLTLTGALAAPAEAVLRVGESKHDLAAPSKDWTAKVTDSVCGLRDPNQVSLPALIDFKACLDATPEMKKVVRDKIDLSTPEGIRLQNEAQNRVMAACEMVRVAGGYCSVWKAIKHKDGRVVADVTEQVKTLL